MEDFLWMLQLSLMPVTVGSIMAFSLSRWSPLGRRGRIRAGFYYGWLVLIGVLFVRVAHGPEQELICGEIAAYGVGISMSMRRLSENLLNRVVADLFFLLYVGVVWLLIGVEAVDWIRRTIT